MNERKMLTPEDVSAKSTAICIRCITLNKSFPSKSKLARYCAKYLFVQQGYYEGVDQYLSLVKYFETALAPCCWDRTKLKTVKGLVFEAVEK